MLPIARWTARLLPATALLLALGCATAPPPPPPAPEPPAAPAPGEPAAPATPAAPTSWVKVAGSSLNVRSGPATSFGVVAKLKRGQRVGVLAEQGDWMQVRLDEATSGWLHRKYVKRDDPCLGDREAEVLDGPPLSFSDGAPKGMVVVEAQIGADGTVRSTKVLSNGTGSDELAAKAEAEARSMRFASPVRRCRPVAFVYEYRRSF